MNWTLDKSYFKRRIIAKVDQFMSLCDKLETRLARSQADGERLMEAVVGEYGRDKNSWGNDISESGQSGWKLGHAISTQDRH